MTETTERTLAIAGARGGNPFARLSSRSVQRAYATLLTNGGRNVSNRFVTKIEDDFSSSPLLLTGSCSPLSLSLCLSPADRFLLVALLGVYNGGGTFAVRCCDDAAGTYMVIM